MEQKSPEPCFDCLQRRINSDFSDELVFSYGLSDSPFPFGSSAVVQLPNSKAETSSSSSSSNFLLVQLPLHKRTSCLTRYIEECIGSSAGTTSSDSSCVHSSGYACVRRITALAPLARVGVCSYAFLEKVGSDFLSGCLEDHVLHSINLLIEGKASGRESVNFLNLVGVPSFDESMVPGCLRHPNIAPIIGLVKSPGYVYLVLPKTPFTLESVLHYSPNALKSEWHIRFLVYQLLSAVTYLHGLGVSHGSICPSNVMLTNLCWSWLRVCDRPLLGSDSTSTQGECGDRHAGSATVSCRFLDDCSSRGIYADLKLSSCSDRHSQFYRWWKGELSNFEYLLVLNRLAGRRWGDHTFHPLMPWVIDFSVKPNESSESGWRDLSKSKWRLAKGDEQLDFTYATSEIPHHLSDECLSELAVCSYKARRLPLSVLRLAVRSVYEPNEYPSNMQRLYQWTPDECIPEFYCDPQIFYSLQSGMSDLAVPSWANSPEEFIKLHRDALESERVSCHIHHWIDITFGYKMSGQAAVDAKNVMLPSSETTMPKSMGRRQLFTQPHPARQAVTKKHDNTNFSAMKPHQMNEADGKGHFLSETAYLQEMEEASFFSEHSGHLSPQYCYDPESIANNIPSVEESERKTSSENLSRPLESSRMCGSQSDINLNYLLQHMEVEDEGSLGYQELLFWERQPSCSRSPSEDFARDIFSVGCVLAELYLKRPLFSSTSLATYAESGLLPGLLQELPPHARVLIEACVQKDWTMRPSAKSVLESPYFPTTVKSCYLFLAPLQLLANEGSRLQYAAYFAKQGALKAMGTFAAEMCVPYFLPLIESPQSDAEAEWAYMLLKEFIKCLTPKAVRTLVLPIIQKILQTTGYLHLKLSLLQGSFVQEIWNLIGKQAYLETIHPLVISNLFIAPQKSSAAAASVLLIGTSEELGEPITVNQTILPLIHCFGKGLCPDGIDVLVRIGNLLGDSFVVRQMLPLLKQVFHSCLNVSTMNKPEPVQSWSALALTDCLTTLDGLVALLPREVIVKEMIEDGRCLLVTILMQTNLELPVLQVAATTLMAICQRIGPDLTAVHVLPQLKELFDELAFSQETANCPGSLARSFKISKSKVEGEAQIESRQDLVLLLYPAFASLLGIEKLRQCCATWLLLEQFLLRCHHWKWEYTGESSRNMADIIMAKRPAFNKGSTSEYNPAKLLLNGVGWSVPQSQGSKSPKNLKPRRFNGINQGQVESDVATSYFFKHEPWFWFPSPAASWDGPDFLGRVGSLKDELSWKIRASVIYSIRAHHGALRSLAVSQDECTVFTAGSGPGFKGTVQKWELSRINCISGYHGHEEAVNDICVLSSSGRIASCDGTVHVWNSRTGKIISVFAEASVESVHLSSTPSSVSKVNLDHSNGTLSSDLLTGAFDGSLYTCMHHLESLEMLVVGTGNASLRFIDVGQGRKLHLWRGESTEAGFASLVSAICSCGSDKIQADGALVAPSWIAAGLSSGHCRVFDLRSGNVVASWRAHDGYVTKLAAPEDHLLVSCSLDRTLRIWDLRKNLPPEPIVFKGHTDGISGFSVWGQDVISISRNKIGLSTLSRSAEEDGHQQITPHKLYMADNGAKSLSLLSSISILPFSRLFIVGTEDGYLKICC